LANILDTLEAHQVGTNLFLYGSVTAVGADTLFLHYKVPKGFVLRLISIFGIQNSGAAKSATMNVARPEMYGRTVTTGVRAPDHWKVMLQSLADNANTPWDLSLLKDPVEFTQDTVLDFRCASAAGKFFKLWIMLKIIEQPED